MTEEAKNHTFEKTAKNVYAHGRFLEISIWIYSDRSLSKLAEKFEIVLA